MALKLTPTDELGAVNACLEAIGESPVNQLENPGVSDATNARTTVHNVSRELQSIGWYWNTECDYRLASTLPDGEVVVGNAVLKIRKAGLQEGYSLSLRGRRLYDRKNFTYNIGVTITADIVVFLPFDYMPEPVRRYVTIRAARQFQEHWLGSDVLTGFTQRDELMAWSNVENDEADNADHNYFTDNQDVVDVWFRPG